MMKTIFAILASVAILAAPASAADIYTGPSTKDAYTAPERAPVNYFQGFYVGASAAWERMGYDETVEIGERDVNTVLDNTAGEDIAGALRIGYDAKFGSFIVAGIGAEISYGGANGNSTQLAAFGCQDCGADIELEKGLAWEINGRLGIAAGRFLAYGKASYGQVQLEANADIFCLDGDDRQPLGKASASDTVAALGFGGGVELAVSEHVSVFTEYMHYDLDAFDVSKEIEGEQVSYRADPDLDVIKLGLNYRF